MEDSIWVEYDRPNHDTDYGVIVGYNRPNFGIPGMVKGWYTIHFYYDAPEGVRAPSLQKVEVYVHWETGAN